MPRNLQRIRTQAQRRQRSLGNNQGDPTIGKQRQNERRWAIRLLIRQHGGQCQYCHKSVTLKNETDPLYATIDHVVPLSQGGEDVITNMTLACLKCNTEKQDKPA